MSVFRELFVEVPQALLEAAVREAQERSARMGKAAVYQHKPTLMDAQENVGQLLCRRYGWRNCEMSRCVSSRHFEIGVRLWCGHMFVIRLDDDLLESVAKPALIVDVLDHMIERAPRDCYCTPREAA